MPFRASFAVAVLLGLMMAAPRAAGDEGRPLQLPVLRDGETCPVTHGSLSAVPRLPYIFGSGRVWFGDGPVYFNLAWKGDLLPPARFSLQRIPIAFGAHRAKTPWVAEPDYRGPIVIRGRELTAAGRPLMFGIGLSDAEAGRSDNRPVGRLELEAPQAGAPTEWSFWATGMLIPAPGCYGVQIETTRGTTVVVFEATR